MRGLRPNSMSGYLKVVIGFISPISLLTYIELRTVEVFMSFMSGKSLFIAIEFPVVTSKDLPSFSQLSPAPMGRILEMGLGKLVVVAPLVADPSQCNSNVQNQFFQKSHKNFSTVDAI